VEISKYQELCKTFDRILKNSASTPQIIANNYLHILNSSPEFLKRFDLSKIGKIKALIRFKLISIVRALQSIFDGAYYYTRQEEVESEVLFVSHLTNSRQILQDNDAYFGDMPNQLLQNGISNSVVLINHAKVSKKQVLEGWSDSKIQRFILSSSLDFISEVSAYFSQLKSKRQLKSILKGLQIDEVLAQDILNNQLSSNTFNALRVAKQVTDIARKINAKFIVTTYEGHAWERLVFCYAREFNPNIKCFGYQHAAVFKHQHAIKRLLNKKYDPDVILTSGLIAKDIFKQGQLQGSKVSCVGSPKHSDSSLVEDKNQCCLVIPEVFVRECLSLFDLSIGYAKQNLNQKFIWRLHPGISFDKLKSQSSILKDLPNNIHLSVGSLDDDIQRCDSVLYRGSTAVVGAINAGLTPIYYQHAADELSIDPIYTHKEGKSIVRNQKELGLALNKDIDIKTKQSLQNFAQDFYTPLDMGILLKEMEI
jgi:hypothetical protein